MKKSHKECKQKKWDAKKTSYEMMKKKLYGM